MAEKKQDAGTACVHRWYKIESDSNGGYESPEQEDSRHGGYESPEHRIRVYEEQGCMVPEPEMIRTEEEIQGIRESSRINIAVLDAVGEIIAPGITTEEIDRLVYTKTRELGGSPAPLGYDGYEKSVCTSVNSQACHGVPSESVVLQEGDIVNVDVSTVFQGYFSDSSRMFCVGRVSGEAARLVETARECVSKGIAHVRPWTFLGDMAAAIQQHAMEQGYSVVSEMGGHGIGVEFHAEPFVSYTAPEGTEMLMVPGMVFTIEPIINQGTAEVVRDPENGWTLYTADGGLSAQWEVTVAVTEDGCEVLTY